MSEIKYLGHASLKIKTNEGTVIYVDPFVGDYDEEADLIFVTHEHYDHNKVELVPHKPNTVTIRYNNLKTGYIYNKTSYEDIEIEAVEAYNANHPKANGVGYVLRFDGIKVYIAGDTSITDDMYNKLSKYGLDYAFLPTDGIYNMSAEEATKAADIINAKHTIPYHTNPKSIFDEQIANNFTHSSKLIIKNGDNIVLND